MDDFEYWMISVGATFQRLKSEKKQRFFDHLLNLSSAHELNGVFNSLYALQRKDFLACLPYELSDKVLSYLDVKTLLTSCQVCRKWNSIISSNSHLWKWLCMKRGFHFPDRQVNGFAEVSFLKNLFLRSSSFVSRLNSGLETETIILYGHTDRVVAIYYYNGRIATGSDDRTVRIWSSDTGDCILAFIAHTVADIKFDDDYVVTASFDGTAACWNVNTGQNVRRYIGHTSCVLSIDYSVRLNILVTGSTDSTVKLWSFSSAELLQTFTSPNKWICNIRLFSDCKCLQCYNVVWNDESRAYKLRLDRMQTDFSEIEGNFKVTSLQPIQQAASGFDTRRFLGFDIIDSHLVLMAQEISDTTDYYSVGETDIDLGQCFDNTCRLSQSKTSSLSHDVNVHADKNGNESSSRDFLYPYVARLRNVFTMSCYTSIRSYIGGGTCFNAFIVKKNGQPFLCGTRRIASSGDFTDPLVLLPVPYEYRESSRRVVNVTLCDRGWLDGIGPEISGQNLFAMILQDNSVYVLKCL